MLDAASMLLDAALDASVVLLRTRAIMVRFGAGNQMEQLVQPLSSILSRIHCCPPIRRRGCRTIHQWSSGIPFRCPTDVTWTGAKRILEEAWKKKELSVFTSPHLSPLPLTTKLTTSTSTTTSPSTTFVPLSPARYQSELHQPSLRPSQRCVPVLYHSKGRPRHGPLRPFPVAQGKAAGAVLLLLDRAPSPQPPPASICGYATFTDWTATAPNSRPSGYITASRPPAQWHQ